MTLVLAQMPSLPIPPPLPHPGLPRVGDVATPPEWWLVWLIGGVVLLLLVLIVWLLLRPRAATVMPTRQPLAACLRSLADLRARSAQIPPPEMSHRVSQVLRRYLGERYAVPALARTTPEIFSDLREFEPGVPIPRAQGVWKERFAPVAKWCDDLSFMPVPVTPEQALELIDQAIVKVQEERS